MRAEAWRLRGMALGFDDRTALALYGAAHSLEARADEIETAQRDAEDITRARSRVPRTVPQ